MNWINELKECSGSVESINGLGWSEQGICPSETCSIAQPRRMNRADECKVEKCMIIDQIIWKYSRFVLEFNNGHSLCLCVCVCACSSAIEQSIWTAWRAVRGDVAGSTILRISFLHNYSSTVSVLNENKRKPTRKQLRIWWMMSRAIIFLSKN